MPSTPTLWTVGHSNHDLEHFAALVHGEGIEFVVDIRSYPYSRAAPHFNREDLQPAMEIRGVRYLFLGQALGGRPERDEHYDAAGHALYCEMAAQPMFQDAVDRVLRGASDHRLALLCSCGQPDECHRRLLVGKVLCDRGAELRHILRDGTIRTEFSVALPEAEQHPTLFGDDVKSWRSARSVSRKRRLSTSSAG